MPLALFRVGMFAWGERDRIGQMLLLLVGLALAVPLLFGAGVSAAVSGLPVPAGCGASLPTRNRCSSEHAFGSRISGAVLRGMLCGA